MLQFTKHFTPARLVPIIGLVRPTSAPVQPRLFRHCSASASPVPATSAHTAADRPANITRPTGSDNLPPKSDQEDEEEAFHHFVTHHPSLLAFRQAHPSLIPSRSALIPSTDEHRAHNLTCTTLSGPDLIHPPPYVFTADRAGAVLAFYRLGRRLADHAGLVHGGVSAALLDECMCRACFPRLPARIAVTAKLEVEYKAPLRVGSTVVIGAETVRVEGRKAWVSACVEDAEGEGRVFVKAEGLFVEPRWAGEMAGVF